MIKSTKLKHRTSPTIAQQYIHEIEILSRTWTYDTSTEPSRSPNSHQTLLHAKYKYVYSLLNHTHTELPPFQEVGSVSLR